MKKAGNSYKNVFLSWIGGNILKFRVAYPERRTATNFEVFETKSPLRKSRKSIEIIALQDRTTVNQSFSATKKVSFNYQLIAVYPN